jgi:uncharacterized protein (DUF2336 family)
VVVGQFLAWVASAPDGRKAAAAAALARAYLIAPPEHEDRAAMAAAITVLVDGSGADVKHALAEVFADTAAAPRHVVAALATDQVSVAQIVLSRSPLFADAELIDIFRAAVPGVQSAIAARSGLSAAVTAMIAEAGNGEACIALLANRQADLGAAAIAMIAARLGDQPAVREKLLERGDLPPEVHQGLVKKVADGLAAMVAARSWTSEARAAAVAHEATDRATIAIAGRSDPAALPALIQHLRVSGQLTTALMLRAVCAGRLEFFEAALAALAEVPLTRVSNLVGSQRLGALRALYGKAGLAAVAFDAFVAALDIWSEVPFEDGGDPRGNPPPQVADAILARFSAAGGEANADGRELAAMLRRFATDQAREAAHEYARAAA